MSRTFDAGASSMPAALRKPVREALKVGWTPGAGRTKDGGWFIYSPKRSKKFYIPTASRDPDTLAKKLRALVSEAYLSERNAFEPDLARVPGAVEDLVQLANSAVMDGAVIIPGPVPSIRCPDCDLEFTGWDAFAQHQGPCQEAVVAAHAAEQEAVVPEGRDEKDRPLEGVPQDATEPKEPVHSGTISTKEEAQLASESTTPTPKPGPRTKVTRDPKTGRARGYKWTQVKGKENPLHEILYEAVRYTRRFTNETDSKYTLRLAQYIETEGLLDRLSFGDPDMEATSILSQIRELVGGGEAQGTDEDAQTIKQLQEDVAAKGAEIEGLSKKVGELRGILSTFSDLAKEANE